MDDLKVEQRNVIHSLFRNGKSSSECYQKLKNTYGKDCLFHAAIYHWVQAFQGGRTSAKLRGGPGKPRTARTEITRNTAATLLADNAQITLPHLAHVLQVLLSVAKCKALAINIRLFGRQYGPIVQCQAECKIYGFLVSLYGCTVKNTVFCFFSFKN